MSVAAALENRFAPLALGQRFDTTSHGRPLPDTSIPDGTKCLRLERAGHPRSAKKFGSTVEGQNRAGRIAA
jgi:hypothetical protein